MKEYFSINETSIPPQEAKASAEALGFIARLPKNFVSMQIDALEKAIDGDSKTLNRFRGFCLFGAPKLDGVEFDEVKIPVGRGQMRARVYRSSCENAQCKSGAIIYYHGGGWCINGVESCMRICQDLVSKTGLKVISCDYSLAPEHPFPAANNDCFDCLKWVSENAAALNVDSRAIFLSGDSAGGGLALSTALRLRGEKSENQSKESWLARTSLAGLVLFYPAVDVDNLERPSYKYFGEGYCLNGGLMRLFAKAYAPSSADARNIYASPIKADLDFDFPVLILSSQCDILHDEAAELAAKFVSFGVRTRYVCVENATHIYITRAGMENAYAKALNEAVEFVVRTRKP